MQTTTECSSGFQQCGVTDSKILCVKSSLDCPYNSFFIADAENTDIDISGNF